MPSRLLFMTIRNYIKGGLPKHIRHRWLSDYPLNFLQRHSVGLTLAAYEFPFHLPYATLAITATIWCYGYLIRGYFMPAGTGKQLAIGPTSAISCLLVYTCDLSNGDTPTWIDLAHCQLLYFPA